jgi:hypothetical protein
MTGESYAGERGESLTMPHSPHAFAEVTTLLPGQAFGAEPRFHPMNRLGALSRGLAAGAAACFQRLLAALHESRRRQAAIERARYRHLIFDPESGISFGSKAREKAPPSD